MLCCVYYLSCLVFVYLRSVTVPKYYLNLLVGVFPPHVEILVSGGQEVRVRPLLIQLRPHLPSRHLQWNGMKQMRVVIY